MKNQIFNIPLNISKPLPADNYLFKPSNGNSKTCSNLTIKTPNQRQQRCLGIFIVNFDQVSLNVLVFPLLTLNK